MTDNTGRATSARNIFIILAIFTLLTVLAVVIWGAVALAMAALLLVPVVFFFLLSATRA